MGGNVVFWVNGGISRKDVLNFLYRGEILLGILAGQVIEEYYSRKGDFTNLVVFTPHSLYVDEETRRKERERLEKDVKNANEIYIPSLGKIDSYEFKGSYQYIRFWILLNLLKHYLEGNYRVFYCDITQGLNVYVDALKEAFRSLVVFYNLVNLGKKEKNREFYMLYSDPIINRSTQEAQLYDDVELKVKVWFDTPITSPDKGFADKHNLEQDELRLLKNYYRAYRAIRYNAPGVVLTFGYDPPERIEETLRKLLNRYLELYNPGDIVQEKRLYEYPLPQDPDEKISIFLALALYWRISKMLSQAGVCENREFTVDDLNKFSQVYDTFGLLVNKDMLERDTKRFENLPADSEWRPLGRLVNSTASFTPRSKDKLKADPGARRNFFAHSGMENNIVCVRRREDGALVFKYREDFYDVLNQFIYEDER